MVPESGNLPVVTLAGGLKLTLLGPTLERLYKLCTVWADVLGGNEEQLRTHSQPDPKTCLDGATPGRRSGRTEKQRDPSAANGSSIMLLAEYDDHALLLCRRWSCA